MKKRNEEGYVLAYVMVVIFVVCSIAVALMSYSLNTIKTQENMIQRMTDKYEAMGEIERIVAEIETYNCIVKTQTTESADIFYESFESVDGSYICSIDHNAPFRDLINSLQRTNPINNRTISVTLDDIIRNESDSPIYKITVSVNSSVTQVSATINFSVSEVIGECSAIIANDFESYIISHNYSFDVTEVIFDSYTIGGAT